jgi:hypothetical protein
MDERAPQPRIGLITRAELFIGRVVVWGGVPEGIAQVMNHWGPNFLHSDSGNTAVASTVIGLGYAIKNRNSFRE